MPLRGILGGAMVGVGEGMTENARELRERALADLRWQRDQQMAGEDRAFRSGEARLSREHESTENVLSRQARMEDRERQRQFQAEQGQLERVARREDRQAQIGARRSELEQQRKWAMGDAERAAREQGYSMSAEEKRALDVAIARNTREQQIPGTFETEAVTDWDGVETELSRTAGGQTLSRRLFGERDERDADVDPSDPLGLRGTMQEGGDREARAPRERRDRGDADDGPGLLGRMAASAVGDDEGGRREAVALAAQRVAEIQRRNPGMSLDEAIDLAIAQVRRRPPPGQMRAVDLDHDEVRDALRGQAN